MMSLYQYEIEMVTREHEWEAYQEGATEARIQMIQDNVNLLLRHGFDDAAYLLESLI